MLLSSRQCIIIVGPVSSVVNYCSDVMFFFLVIPARLSTIRGCSRIPTPGIYNKNFNSASTRGPIPRLSWKPVMLHHSYLRNVVMCRCIDFYNSQFGPKCRCIITTSEFWSLFKWPIFRRVLQVRLVLVKSVYYYEHESCIIWHCLHLIWFINYCIMQSAIVVEWLQYVLWQW